MAVWLRTVWVFLLVAALAFSQDAESLYKKARKAQSKGDYTKAYLYSSQAVAEDPNNTDYWAFSQAVRRRGLAGIKIEATPGAVPDADAESELTQSAVSEQELAEIREALPPPILQGNPVKKSFHLRGDAKRLWEEVGAAYGIRVLFDSEFQAGQARPFILDDADWKVALRAAEMVTGSFVIAINEHLALVAKDTAQKRTELEPYMSIAVPFPDVLSPAELQDAARAVQSSFDMTKMGVDNGHRLVVFRDRVSRLKPALEMFRQLTLHRGQVVTDVELLAISESYDSSYGITLQSSYPIAWLGNPTPFTLIQPTTGANYRTFGGGKTMFGIGLSGAEIFASMSRGWSQSIVKSQMRGVDGQPAQFHVGDKYPVVTGTFQSASELPGSNNVLPAPVINFEDLGVVLKVTPRVHNAQEVSLAIEAEFKTLSGQTNNGIPVISNRKFATQMRMRFDEVAVMSGLVSETLTQSWSGIPILVTIPALRSNTKSTLNNQLLLTITPHLVDLPPTEFETSSIWVGTESRPLTPLD